MRLISLFVDTVLIYLGFIFSFLIRFPGEHRYQPFFGCFPFLTLIYIFCLVIVGAYRRRFTSYTIIFQRLFLGFVFGSLASASFVYIFRVKWGKFPSSIFLISFILNLSLVFACKSFLYKISQRIFKRIIFLKEDNFRNLKDLKDTDEIVLTTEFKDIEKIYLLLELAQSLKIKLSILPELYDRIISQRIKEEQNFPFLIPVYFENNPEESLIRALDILVSILILFFSLPIFILVSILIKIDSYGPIIYKQIRIGKDGREFVLYKFRTMIKEAEKYTGPVLASLNDWRVTALGRILRRTRLDELPQLFNILKGEMSLVGPRPERPHFVKRHRALQGIRLSVKPGLVGLAQIRSSYHTPPRNKLRYDYLYIRNRSLLLNLNILLRTVLTVLLKPGS